MSSIKSNIIDETSRQLKAISGTDENSRKALYDMCKLIKANFNGLPLESKMPVLNTFVISFMKFTNRMSVFDSADGLELLHTCITMLSSLATSQEPISQLHELVFYDLTSKLFSLLCKLMEATRQAPRNFALSLLTAKAYIFIGLPGYKLKMPDDVVSSHQDSIQTKESRPHSGGTNKKVRSLCLDPLLASLENMRLSSSSSNSNESACEKSVSVRRNALNFLCLLLQNASPFTVMNAWPVLLSTPSTTTWASSSTDNESWFLLSLVLHDQSTLVRYMACSVVIELVDESVKACLAVAQENSIGAPSTSSTSATPFTPYSVQLASHLREIHRCLIAAALHSNSGQDKCPQMVVHVMKAIQFLVRITPYHRLRPGLLTEVFKLSSSLLRSKDVDVRVACLTVFGEILANNNAHSLLEMECLVRSCKPPAFSRPLSFCNSPTGSISGADTPLLVNEQGGFQPWLLKIAMESAAANSVYSYPVKIESLQLLNALVKFYSKTLFFEAKQLPELFKFIYAAMYAADPVYLAHVCFVLETIGHKLNEELISEQLPFNEIVLFWSDTLSNHIFRLLQAPSSIQQNATLKAALFDALSSIGPLVFDRLPANLRILCTTTPLDIIECDQLDKSLRASAIRCLGHLVSFKSMQKDCVFLQNCVDISLRHAKSEPACQCAAAWLLRNALDNEGMGILSGKSEEVLIAGINLTLKGPDKAKPHAMTVIWRVLMSSKQAAPLSRDVVSSAVREVICPVLNGKVKGPVKLQWNAADGLVDAFSCEKSLSVIEPFLPQLFDTCCGAMIQSPNFRTRATLAAALQRFALIRTAATSLGKQCLSAFFEAFTSVHENIKSPSEFRHVDALVAALWLGFVTWLAKLGDDSSTVLTSWLSSVSAVHLEIMLRSIKMSLANGGLGGLDENLVGLCRLAVQQLDKVCAQSENAKLLSEAITSCSLTLKSE